MVCENSDNVSKFNGLHAGLFFVHRDSLDDRQRGALFLEAMEVIGHIGAVRRGLKVLLCEGGVFWLDR
jgi:hypothetical protein